MNILSNSAVPVDTVLIIFTIILISAGLIFLLILLIYCLVKKHNQKYKDFVMRHSKAILRLKEINKEYLFFGIKDFDMENKYDNENFYREISCQDYLVYQLVYKQKEIKKAIRNVIENKINYERYKAEVDMIDYFGKFDIEVPFKNIDKVLRYERECFKNVQEYPQITFAITVNLIRTNINKQYIENKTYRFSRKEIEGLILRINNRENGYYKDEYIWNAICKVERGKVSNRLRFMIYKRDGYRCQNCGRFTNDLEIDHIIPISKGGKTEYNNLQTLCHRCNVEKGDKIDWF